MFQNYFKTAIRHLIRHPLYSIKSIFSLVLGITTCLFILTFVHFERSYDTHFPDHERMFRITTSEQVSGNLAHSALTPSELGPVVEQMLPGYNVTRLYHWPYNDIYVRHNEHSFAEERFYRTDSTFFSVFDIGFVYGSSAHALSQPYSVVVSQNTAVKYFGETNPVGQVLLINNQDAYTVTGVIPDMPPNTHAQFDFLAFNGRGYPDGWTEKKVWTYIKAPDDIQDDALASPFAEIIATHYPPAFIEGFSFALQPLSAIHLDTHLASDLEIGGSRTYVQLFSLLAFVFLLIGCINYVNLETARASWRMKEVGVRKAIGATKMQVKFRALIESLCSSAIAVVLSAGLYMGLRAPINLATGLYFPPLEVENAALWMALLASIFVITGVAGGYPALYLSWFPVKRALKGRMVAGRGQGLVRESLVVVQFVVTLILIVGSLAVHRQIHFMLEDNRGMDRENIVMVRVPGQLARAWDWDARVLTDELNRVPAIQEVSSAEVPWGRGVEQFYVHNTILGDATQVLTNVLWTSDDSYAAMYGLTLVEGRTRLNPFDEELGGREVVINQKTAQQLELTEPIGAEIAISMEAGEWEKGRVVGVVLDVPYRTLHEEIQPLLFTNSIGFSDIAVLMEPGMTEAGIKQLETIWAEIAPEWPLDYFYLDENYKEQYRAEEQIGVMSRVFALIAIAIACFGLLGLISYIAEHRTKEIGIRKVLGASSLDITWLISKDFVRLIMIASVIAIPLAIAVLSRWLQHFAFRTQLSMELVVVPIIVLSVMIMVTAGYRVILIATERPIKSIRYE